MRLIQVFVPREVRPSVEDALDDIEIDHVFTRAEGQQAGWFAYIPVPTGAVDGVLDRLYEAGLDKDVLTLTSEINHANIQNVDALTDQYVEGPTGRRGASHTEIRERAKDLKPDTATYVAFAALSAIVAAGGLLLNSAIVIVGSMVIAPFAGSTLSASVAAVISDQEMAVQSAMAQAVGLAVAFVGAILMSGLLLLTGFIPEALVVSRIDQVSVFLTPNLLTLAIAIAAGIAGALALATDLPVSIAGVAVAAAIVPATATAGLGFVWGKPLIVLGAVVLLLMNVVFINLASFTTLYSLGYRSSVMRSVRANASLSVRTGIYSVIVVGFVLLVAFTSVATYQHLMFEQAVNEGVQSALDDPEYRSLELVGVSTQYNDMGLLGSTESVTVTVSRTSDSDFDTLPQTLQDRISDRTGQGITVNVRYLDYERVPASTTRQATDQPIGGLDLGAEAILRRITRQIDA